MLVIGRNDRLFNMIQSKTEKYESIFYLSVFHWQNANIHLRS